MNNYRENVPMQAERPTAAIEVVLTTLRERVESLDRIAGQLESRFGPVLRIEPPAAQRTDGRIGPISMSSSKLGGVIEEVNVGLEAVLQRLASLLDRAEL